MGVFNALIAVKSDATHCEKCVIDELHPVLQPWIPSQLDWWAVGVSYWRFAAILDPVRGWIDEDGMPDPIPDAPAGYVYVPIRCHF